MEEWKKLHWKPEQGIKDEEEMTTVQIGRDRTEGIPARIIGKKMCIHFPLQPRAGAKVTDSHYSSAVSKYVWNIPEMSPISSWCQSMQNTKASTAVVYNSSPGYGADTKIFHGGWWPDRWPVVSLTMEFLLLFSFCFLVLETRKLYSQTSHTEI